MIRFGCLHIDRNYENKDFNKSFDLNDYSKYNHIIWDRLFRVISKASMGILAWISNYIQVKHWDIIIPPLYVF